MAFAEVSLHSNQIILVWYTKDVWWVAMMMITFSLGLKLRLVARPSSLVALNFGRGERWVWCCWWGWLVTRRISNTTTNNLILPATTPRIRHQQYNLGKWQGLGPQWMTRKTRRAAAADCWKIERTEDLLRFSNGKHRGEKKYVHWISKFIETH